nr:MAG TPA: hypothetical protein [Caudoviricetes sp.]
MNEKGDKTMIYIGDNLPNHDHPEENREGTIMKPRWRVVRDGTYWAVEMKITEKVRAVLTTWRDGKPVWEEKENAQAIADALNRS